MPSRSKSNLLTGPLGPWHAVGAGGLSALVGLLILCVAFFQWPSAHVPFGAFLFPFGLLAGLGGFGFSTVALFRSRDIRILVAALLGAAGIAMIVGGFLWAARQVEHSTANKRSALDARTALCFHIKAGGPGVSESGR